MGIVKIVLLVIHIIVSLILIISVLLHSGRGGGLAGILGGGGSMFSGAYVAEKNLDRITIISGIIFALTTIGLVWVIGVK